ncbi:MAG: hypothetical protein LBF65_01520 [Holosporales bacterium]|nr:hypothetical protein [Holosporales bacterium]
MVVLKNFKVMSIVALSMIVDGQAMRFNDRESPLESSLKTPTPPTAIVPFFDVDLFQLNRYDAQQPQDLELPPLNEKARILKAKLGRYISAMVVTANLCSSTTGWSRYHTKEGLQLLIPELNSSWTNIKGTLVSFNGELPVLPGEENKYTQILGNAVEAFGYAIERVDDLAKTTSYTVSTRDYLYVFNSIRDAIVLVHSEFEKL